MDNLRKLNLKLTTPIIHPDLIILMMKNIQIQATIQRLQMKIHLPIIAIQEAIVPIIVLMKDLQVMKVRRVTNLKNPDLLKPKRKMRRKSYHNVQGLI